MLPNIEIIDADSLKAIPDDVVRQLGEVLGKHGFTSENLLHLFGKEVTRHINISQREEDYLRRHVLDGLPHLKLLVDLLLLHHPVSTDRLSDVFGGVLLGALVDHGLFVSSRSGLAFRGYITPIDGRWFLNDGDAFNDNPGHVIQIVLEQPYLIKSAKLAARSVLSRSKGCILDLCSGSGVIGQALQPKAGWSITGWDINPRAIEYARFNARLNGAHDATYLYTDVMTATSEKQYDVVVANPPYNAHVSPHKKVSATDITLHSGVFGWDIPGAIFDKVDSLLVPGGVFALCGIHMMNDSVVAHPAISRMRETGSVVVLHKVISPAATWEAMRCQFNCTPDFLELPEGHLLELVKSASFFNEVTWAITLWKKGGTPGYFSIYNLPTDGVLISPQAERELSDIFTY